MTTTPADELKAAAERLRTVAPSIPLPWRGFANPVADWLDSVAGLHEESHAHGCQWCADEDWPCADTRRALTVARTINGS